MTLHNKCASQLKPECTLGPNRDHIIPPSCICPTVLVRKLIELNRMKRKRLFFCVEGKTKTCTKQQWFETRRIMRRRIDSIISNITIVQHTSVVGVYQSKIWWKTRRTVNFFPLEIMFTVDICRIMRKFQYLLNPRQVFNLVKTGPMPG